MAEFGELLAELRMDQKMKQKELAVQLHVTSGTISNYENGVHLPDIDKLIALADIFQVTTDYLLGRCSVNVSSDYLEKTVCGTTTVGKVIEDILNLPLEKKKAIALILNDMKII